MKNLLSPPLSGLPETPFEQLVDEAAASLPGLPEDPSDLLFALDIDGTLLHPGGVTPRVFDALQEAQEVGAHVVIATGRGVASTAPVVNEVALTHGWTVCSNGALTLRWEGEPEVATRHDFDPREVAEQVLQAIPSALLARDEEALGLLVSAPFPRGELLFHQVANDLEEVIGRRTTKLVVRAPEMDREHFAQMMHLLELEGCELSVGWTAWADIGPMGVTKASALEDLAVALGVPSHGTIAIGDGMNDIAMLRWAAHGVAMGSADSAVINAADATTGPVEHDGAAAVIRAVLQQY
ncbi:HAD family hydrolase [Scrofimicrobium canadense]|uniref:HAD family hydrolase n=1 Tax=Scrofimicrobium canadense TaxID=2652290 RepID=UPI00197E1799|nr:HAD family hydrolase [Scrofimicrobium canadense]